MYLFYMEEILGIKGDGCGWYWNILIQCTTIADIGPYSECHRFSLDHGNTHREHTYAPIQDIYWPVLIHFPGMQKHYSSMANSILVCVYKHSHRWIWLSRVTCWLPWLSPVEWRPAAPSPDGSVPVLGSGLGSGSGPGPAPPAPPPERHLSLMVC